MLARLRTLRMRLLVAMVGTTVVALAGAYGVVSLIESGDQAADRRKDARVARTLADREAHGVDPDELSAFQALLPDDQVVVVKDGRRVYVGPARRGHELEVTETASFPGGHVTVYDHRAASASPMVPIAVGAAVAALLIVVAAIVATLVTRSVRVPIGRAIAAADRVAAGDLTARMGTAGPDELARLGGAFDGMAARLEHQDRDQRRFLADVAHEIATPVGTLSGLAGALADGSIDTPDERAEALALIEDETGRLRSLLDNLRELTRLDLFETASDDAVDLVATCRRVAARFAHAARDAGVTLEVRARPATVSSDGRLLDTILDNLVSNAIRHTPPGGRVTIALHRHRHEVVLAVADTGTGIAAEHRPRVFDRLYRTDASRDRRAGGSGLGLAIAQRAARALGGRIELESELGRGSEFRLVMPDARPRVRARQGAARR